MISPLDENIRLALSAAGGNMKIAAEKLRIPCPDLMERLARTPKMREFLTQLRGKLADDTERSLEAAIDESCPWTIKFALTTLGASRGYGTRPKADNRKPDDWKSNPEQPGVTDAQIAVILDEAKGNLSLLAAKLAMLRVDVKKIVAGRPALQAIIVEAHERLVDRAELALHGAVGEKKSSDIKFVLKTIGREIRTARRGGAAQAGIAKCKPQYRTGGCTMIQGKPR